MTGFAIGDRVKHPEYGSGKVTSFHEVQYSGKVGVEFDEQPPEGHNCWGTCRHTYGLFVPLEQLELAGVKETSTKELTISEAKEGGYYITDMDGEVVFACDEAYGSAEFIETYFMKRSE